MENPSPGNPPPSFCPANEISQVVLNRKPNIQSAEAISSPTKQSQSIVAATYYLQWWDIFSETINNPQRPKTYSEKSAEYKHSVTINYPPKPFTNWNPKLNCPKKAAAIAFEQKWKLFKSVKWKSNESIGQIRLSLISIAYNVPALGAVGDFGTHHMIASTND